MLNEIKQNNFGTTLLEMIVAVALFSVTILAATEIFQMVVNGQRSAVAGQNTQESIRYALEVMSKEIRMAQKARPADCLGLGLTGKVFKTAGSGTLQFKNSDEECVEYFLEDDINGISRLKIDRDGVSDYITPDEIEVSNLEFIVIDDLPNEQSMITLKMDIEALGKELHKSKMKIQTTISSRYYE